MLDIKMGKNSLQKKKMFFVLKHFGFIKKDFSKLKKPIFFYFFAVEEKP
jgi:hypothetical protein